MSVFWEGVTVLAYEQQHYEPLPTLRKFLLQKKSPLLEIYFILTLPEKIDNAVFEAITYFAFSLSKISNQLSD